MNYQQLSDTEESVDEQLAPQKQTKVKPRSRVFRVTKSFLLLYSITATTTALICSGFSLNLLRQIHTQHFCEPAFSHGSFQAAYLRSPNYMSLEHKYDELWEGLNSSSLVFDLADPSEGGRDMPASISMFHQLHCLSSLRSALQQASEGLDVGKDWRDNAHWPHCMDYLRKTILCHADDTIERQPVHSNGTKANFIDGTHDIRRCNNNKKLIKMMKDTGAQLQLESFP